MAKADIPESHRDLLEGPRSVALTTVMPDGQPQTTVVWCDFDGTHVRVNSMSRFQKAKNMRANPKVTVLAYEMDNPLRNIEVRGTVVEMMEEGAMERQDGITCQYTDHPGYYGHVFPVEQRAKESRIICKIKPKKINMDAIQA